MSSCFWGQSFSSLDLQAASSHLSLTKRRSCFNSSLHIFYFPPTPHLPLPNDFPLQYLPPFGPPHLLPNHLVFLTPSSPPVQTFIEFDSEYSEDEEGEEECYK